MNRTAKLSDRTYCVDLAKNKFQVHAFLPSGERVQQLTLTRSKFDAFFADPARIGGLVVMEACAGSHYWARRFEHRGYGTKLVPPQFVAKQRLGNKNDGNDADGIFAVHRDPRVRPVPVKTVEQQDLCALHRVRELLVSQHTQYINQARGLLAERGYVAARGTAGFTDLLTRLAEQPSQELTPSLIGVIELLVQQLRQLETQIDVIEKQLQTILTASPVAQRIDSVFGIGFITATAFAGEYGACLHRFADSRQFAASLGITPTEHSSGQKRRLGAITKRGNPYLRRLLVQCAQSVLKHCKRRDDALCLLGRRLLAQNKRHSAVVVAIANRLARIIYAVIKHQEDYRPHAVAQAL